MTHHVISIADAAKWTGTRTTNTVTVATPTISGDLAAEAPGFRTEETMAVGPAAKGQGEFARDGYSAQGQFSNQRVAQYGDQGYGQDYGRQGIGWQNRHDDDNQAFRRGTDWEQGPPREREFRGERQVGGWQGPYGPDPGSSITFHTPAGRLRRRRERLARRSGGYWGQGAGGGQGIGGSGSWRQEQPAGWGAQGHGGHGQRWEGSGGTGYSAAGSWMAGPHSGRGPQGYQRSDARIEEDVCEHLTHHGMLDATGIQVQVENGEVTLTGTVESRQAKRLAEDILDSISGVRDVHNQLRVQRDQGQTTKIRSWPRLRWVRLTAKAATGRARAAVSPSVTRRRPERATRRRSAFALTPNPLSRRAGEGAFRASDSVTRHHSHPLPLTIDN